MRLQKRIKHVLIFIIVILVLPMVTFETAAFQQEEGFYMSDISEHWGQEDIKELSYMGILKGDNMNANPDAFVSRAEFTALIIRALSLEETTLKEYNHFKDITQNDWFYKDISIAKQEGIISGNGDGTFSPYNQITREEIMLIIDRSIHLKNQKLSNKNSFNDIKKNYAYMKELDAAIESGIVKGYGDNTFKPKNNALRSEAAVMINRLLHCSNNISIVQQDINKEKVKLKSLINKYIEEYQDKKNSKDKNLEYNIDRSIGKNKDDNYIKSDIIDLYSEKNIDVKEDINNIEIDITYIEGNIAKVVATSDVLYTRTFRDGTVRIKAYKKEQNFSFRNIYNEWYVYDIEERLYKDEKINLVWEQISVRTPDMSGVQHMEGLNVISPTWFKIKDYKDDIQGIKNNHTKVYSDLQSDIRMVDLGDISFIDWAHNNDYDVWPLFNNEFDINVAKKVLNSKESRRKSIELLLEYTEKYKLDGINVDFENMYYNDRHVFTQFVRELAPVMREQGVIVSVDVTKIEPTSITWSMCYDRRSLGEVSDYIALMAYDQNGTWSTISGSVAQYSWVENSIKGMLNQVRNDKLLLGLPFYVRAWEEVNNKVVKTIAISMDSAQKLIRENNAKIEWDDKSGQHLATYERDSKTFKIWLEDADSINLKSSLIHKYNLPGIASWSRKFETQDIWHVLNKSLNHSNSYEEWINNNKGKWYVK